MNRLDEIEAKHERMYSAVYHDADTCATCYLISEVKRLTDLIERHNRKGPFGTEIEL